MPSKKKIFLVILSLIAMQVAVSIFGAVLISTPQNPDKIQEGVTVAGADLGGLTKKQALVKLAQATEPGLANLEISITYNGAKWPKPYSELGLSPDYEQTVEKAYETGREQTAMARAFSAFRLKRQGIEMPLLYRVDKEKVNSFIISLSQNIDKPAVNAAINFKGNKLVPSQEKKGYKVLVRESVDALVDAVNRGDHASPLIVKELTPAITVRQLEGIKEDLAIAVTSFDSQDAQRAENIKLAAGSLNNTLIRPGETFSFNKKVGPRSREKGFNEAPVIANGNLSDGIGGGVCQVSTTLYQAALQAGLDVVERHPHSLTPAYVPLGQDAAVAEGQLDLQLKNSTEQPMFIAAYTEGDELFVRIMGAKDGAVKTRLISEVVEELQPKVVVRKDPNLDKGASEVVVKGQKGYRVKVYRETTGINGKKQKELISEDNYKPTDTVIRLGTKVKSGIKVNKK